MSFRDRLFSRLLIQPDGCVVWQGSKRANGYGQIKRHGKGLLVHRVMYEMFAEPIPDGMHIDHLCGNKACANVAHLEVVTPAENTRRHLKRTGGKLVRWSPSLA